MGGRETHWAVLGAGMLGLTLALRLAAAGHRVTVLEAAPAAGGLTGAFRDGDVTWDRFYHVIGASDRHLLALLAELGLDRELVWGTTRTNFFDGARLLPLNDVFDYLRLPAMGLVDKLRMAANIAGGAAFANGAKLEDERAEDWLVRWSGRRAFETVWRPLLRSKLGANADRASAAYVLAVIRRFYGAREGRRRTELFGYVRGGYAHIVDTLLARLGEAGVTVETGTPVSRVGRGGDGLEVHTPAGARRFERVVVTFAGPLAAATLDGLPAAERERHGALACQGVVCASLLLRRPLGRAYLTYITDTSIPFTTVIEMTDLVPPAAYGGRHLVYLPRYVPSEDPFLDADDAAVEAAFMPGLARMFPDLSPADVDGVRVARARYVMAVPTLGYSRRLPAMETSVPGLFVSNSAQIVNASLSVNETVELAGRTAARLLQDVPA